MGARVLVCLAVCLVVSCGGRDAPDDQGLHTAIANHHSGAEVTFDATVLSEPVQSGDHEDFDVLAATGEVLEIDHNTSLAREVPLHKGDMIVVHGQLYIDPGPRYGVHCTHAQTSSGCPDSGWIEFQNVYYE